MNGVESVYPGGPRIRNEVIQNIAKKSNLRVAYQPAKCGRKKNILIEEEQKLLVEFLDQSDITYIIPGRKESIYVKTNGVKQFVPNVIYFGQLEKFWKSQISQIWSKLEKLFKTNFRRNKHSTNCTILQSFAKSTYLIDPSLTGHAFVEYAQTLCCCALGLTR